MKPKNIDLTNKCGSCCWFEPIEKTCSGYCLRNKYGEDVVHDPAHPYLQVARSRMKCVDYNAKPKTNADHIRSMSDDDLAKFILIGLGQYVSFFAEGMFPHHPCPAHNNCLQCGVEWLGQPFDENVWPGLKEG